MDDDFRIRFPCYVLVVPPLNIDQDSGQLIVDEQTNYLTLEDADGQPALIAFTEIDLADNFVRHRNLHCVALPIDAPHELAQVRDIINRLQGHQVDVLFDKTSDHPGFCRPFGAIFPSLNAPDDEADESL